MKNIILAVLVVSAVITTGCASKKACSPCNKTVVTKTK